MLGHFIYFPLLLEAHHRSFDQITFGGGFYTSWTEFLAYFPIYLVTQFNLILITDHISSIWIGPWLLLIANTTSYM